MAKVVLGIGSSHSPVLLMEPPAWLARAAKDDKSIFVLHGHDGKRVSYDELLAKADPALVAEIADEKLWERHRANQRAIEATATALREARPDVVLIIGDDHKEVFNDDNMPALSIYWGDTLPYRPIGIMKWKYDPTLSQELWYPQDSKDHPVAASHARSLIEALGSKGFDPSHQHYFREQQGAMSHSFGYVFQRMMKGLNAPVIPVSINTYYPPNNMLPRRAYQLGKAMREVIEAWPDDLRVAVVATGGLSHFVVDEKFDRSFLDLMARGGEEGHAALELVKLQSGNSEFRCWSALAGAVEGMKMELIDYIPCYRSPAGTGCGMAFATWS